MQVQKLRGAADANGLIPAGTFFAQLAAKLEDANFQNALREAELEEEDRTLEATYRKRSAARAQFTEREHHAVM
ncbi:MAG: hypothetical protein NT015_17215 [Alphaproteobacteria bacterium]|nr:hypothetical protein [Alphaproteobacteria bacterium]